MPWLRERYASRALRAALALALACLAAGAGPAPPLVDPVEFEKATRVILCDCDCHPQSVHDCACGRAEEMRNEIAEEIRKGLTGDQVIAAYVARYGDKIRIAPVASGFNLVAWLGPGVALLAGAAGVFVVIRRWTRAPSGAHGPGEASLPPDDPYLERLERELREEA